MKWIRKVLKGISFTAAMFVFQACYGMPEDYYEKPLYFRVVDYDTGEPLKDIEIETSILRSDSTTVDSWINFERTDENGMAIVWANDFLMKYTFTSKDSLYIQKDTILNPMAVDTVDIALKKR